MLIRVTGTKIRALTRLLAAAFGLVLLICGMPARAEPRVALVIGNATYGGAIGKLPNTIADATLMADTLKQAGFAVMVVHDIDQKQMKRAVVAFGARLAAAGPSATGLFFFAGHGVQVVGSSYLIPIGAEIERESDVNLEAIAVDLVLEQMEFAGCATKIVMLDASRDNPFSRGFQSGGQGLAELTSRSRGLFISYSTAPGTVAHDGKGPHSPYVAAVADAILTPGLTIHEVFDRARRDVLKATEDRQLTWDSSSIIDPFYFVPKKGD